jgi:hypothetical protein
VTAPLSHSANDFIAKNLDAEVSAATSLTPEDPTNGSTYTKARSAALDACAAAEAIARGDSDAAPQAIERTITAYAAICEDYGLALAEVLPLRTCSVCSAACVDYHLRGGRIVCSMPCAHDHDQGSGDFVALNQAEADDRRAEAPASAISFS